jgi:hypothetical protein
VFTGGTGVERKAEGPGVAVLARARGVLTRVSCRGEGARELEVAKVFATLFNLVNNVRPWPTEGWEVAAVEVAFTTEGLDGISGMSTSRWRKRICGSRNGVVVIHVRSNRTEVISGADYLGE